MKTTAQAIADELGGDGSVFETEDGRTLDEMATHAKAYRERHPSEEWIRYEFYDASVIVDFGAYWDIEGKGRYSFGGLEQDDRYRPTV